MRDPEGSCVLAEAVFRVPHLSKPAFKLRLQEGI